MMSGDMTIEDLKMALVIGNLLTDPVYTEMPYKKMEDSAYRIIAMNAHTNTIGALEKNVETDPTLSYPVNDGLCLFL